jgi:hypothetical protein
MSTHPSSPRQSLRRIRVRYWFASSSNSFLQAEIRNLGVDHEQERGESVAEFSIGNAASSTWHTENRQLSEYGSTVSGPCAS